MTARTALLLLLLAPPITGMTGALLTLTLPLRAETTVSVLVGLIAFQLLIAGACAWAWLNASRKAAATAARRAAAAPALPTLPEMRASLDGLLGRLDRVLAGPALPEEAREEAAAARDATAALLDRFAEPSAAPAAPAPEPASAAG
jgi:hypothetical protein